MAPPDEALKERFARIDERFDRVDENFARVDERFVEVNRRITETAKETDRRLKEVDRRITDVDRRITDVDRRITEKSDETNRRLEGIEVTNLELKHQMTALNVTFQRGSFAIVASVLGVIAAILAQGG